jgi:hypothetical protein
MLHNPPPGHRPSSDQLHPAIYVTLICLAAWFAIAIWGFAIDSYTDWLLVVVSGFILVAASITAILSRVRTDGTKWDRKRFRDWVTGDFSTHTDKSRSLNAAVEILLPLGAAAIGMTAFAIVFMAEHAT